MTNLDKLESVINDLEESSNRFEKLVTVVEAVKSTSKQFEENVILLNTIYDKAKELIEINNRLYRETLKTYQLIEAKLDRQYKKRFQFLQVTNVIIITIAIIIVVLIVLVDKGLL